MTDEEFEQLHQMVHASVQDETDIDVARIDHLLSLTPTQRLADLEEFLEALDAVMEDREGPSNERWRDDKLARLYLESAKSLREQAGEPR